VAWRKLPKPAPTRASNPPAIPGSTLGWERQCEPIPSRCAGRRGRWTRWGRDPPIRNYWSGRGRGLWRDKRRREFA